MYKCGWNGCEKAYGTLNHLNAHVTMQSHGQKRTPEGRLVVLVVAKSRIWLDSNHAFASRVTRPEPCVGLAARPCAGASIGQFNPCCVESATDNQHC